MREIAVQNSIILEMGYGRCLKKAAKRRIKGEFRKRTKYVRRAFRSRPRRLRPLPAIMKPRQTVNFKVCDFVPLITGTSESMALATLTPSNLADPFGGASSVIQPTGLDQWNAFFARYRCLVVYFELQFSVGIVTSAQNTSLIVGYRVNQTSSLGVTDAFQTICNEPRTRWKYLAANEDTAVPRQVRMRGSYRIKSLFPGQNEGQDFDTVGTSGAPTLLPTLQLFACSALDANLADSLNICNVLTKLTLKGYFHDRQLIPVSVI